MKAHYKEVIRRIPVTVVFIIFSHNLFSQENAFLKKATIFLVRHAEKEAGNNPGLNELGMKRAGYLLAALEGIEVKKVFVTQYRRTQQTADSLRLQRNADTIHYSADITGDALIKALQQNRVKKEQVLVIGHSNTLPIIMGRLGLRKPIFIGEDEYDAIYRIKYVKGKAVLSRKRFGNPLMPQANTRWEKVL